MSVNLARTAGGWWVVTPAGLMRLGLPAATTAELLTDRAALDEAVQTAQAAAAAAPGEAVPAESAELLSPVTAPARVVAQAVNYRSHALDSGMDPRTVPPAFFRKASHSLTGPAGDILRPDGVGFLDYEVELGLVIGADLPPGTTVTDASLARYVAALVVTDDISARQIQLTKTQFYEAKSYPTFTPAGPWLTGGELRAPVRRHPAHHLGGGEVLRLAPDLPYPAVRLLPVLHGGLDELDQPLPIRSPAAARRAA
jgi:2-keto-4-pentenoate hydratase/2-oxohepta-3-ene-1,7-dioic acid hydratase in catechol pathway